VTVNAICPGYVATEMTWSGARNIAARTGNSFEEAVAAMARINPGGRLIEPAEVAAVAVKWLAEDAPNGETIVLDGS
jgi:NAD(P)-dependent dehydrogenase (short-subunit alcohol dehydrogenase family)